MEIWECGEWYNGETSEETAWRWDKTVREIKRKGDSIKMIIVYMSNPCVPLVYN